MSITIVPKFTVVNLKPPCDHLTASDTREQDRFIKLRLKYLHIDESDFYTVVITFFLSLLITLDKVSKLFG